MSNLHIQPEAQTQECCLLAKQSQQVWLTPHLSCATKEEKKKKKAEVFLKYGVICCL